MSHTAAPANSNTSPRAIWSLTWPQMLMMYVQFFSGFTTVWTAGQISADLQAALGMITQCGIFFMVLCMALSSGGMAAVSQSSGSRSSRPSLTTQYRMRSKATIAAFFAS